MKEPIGGFIELEFRGGNGSFHPGALALANGRACFNLFLSEYRPSKVYVPFYTCDALLEPLIINHIPYTFYSLDENLEPIFDKTLDKGKEYLVYVNYFDIKNKTTLALEKKYGEGLIVDNTQGFFQRNYPDAIASFNSCRKFFGVPDGGYLYIKKAINKDFPKNTVYKYEHLVSRASGKADVYYGEFLENEKILGSDIRGMSLLSEKILQHTDYEFCRNRRIDNFKFLHQLLVKYNQFEIDITSLGTPHYYPFLPVKPIDKAKLITERIFIPTLWPDVLNRESKGFELEKRLTKNMLPLPIDQRYDCEEMTIIMNKLLTLL